MGNEGIFWSPKIIDKQVVNSQQSHKSVNKKIET